MKDQNVETIHLPISINYVQHWGFWEAVRELLQNKVDTGSGWVDHYEDNLVIQTSIGKLDRSTLLLGESSKRDDESSIGCYGEGYKLAFLVLTRLGYSVTVYNYDEVWEVFLEEHPQLGVDCLTIKVKRAIHPSKSVEISILGVGYEQIGEIFEKYLHTPSDFKSYDTFFIYDIVAEDNGSQILKINGDYEDSYEDYSKKLFVGGLFVCDLGEDFKYSYNFAPNILELDRDRSSVSDFYLGLEVVRLLVRSNNIEKLIKMVSDKDPDVGTYGNVYAEDDSGVKGKTVGDLTEEQFYSTFGENAYPINSSSNSAKISALTEICMKLGLKPVTVSSLYYQMLPDSVKELPEMPEALDGKASSALDKFLKEHWKLLKSQSKRRLEKLITSYKIGGC